MIIRTPAQRAASVAQVATDATRKWFTEAERLHDAEQVRKVLADRYVPVSPRVIWNAEISTRQIEAHKRINRVCRYMVDRMRRADEQFAGVVA